MGVDRKKAVVTVLLPFFQVGDELDRAIASIVRQTFTDWELLLISNNGSRPGLHIADKWVQLDSRVHLLDESRQGIAFALNTGLQHANGRLVARMDGDDEAHPERLQKQVGFLDAHPEIDVVSCQTSYASNIPGSEGYSLFVEWQNGIITVDDHARLRFIESPLAHPTVVFRKELTESFGPYDTGNIPEDYELWLRWMDQGVRFYKLSERLLEWNDHAARLSRVHENYSREAFYRVKCHYLAKWIRRHVPKEKKIIVCGSSRIGRKRAVMLEEGGVQVYGFTDVKKRPNRQVRFLPIGQLVDPGPWLLVNFIARRGVGESIREHFVALGFAEGRDFVLAG